MGASPAWLRRGWLYGHVWKFGQLSETTCLPPACCWARGQACPQCCPVACGGELGGIQAGEPDGSKPGVAEVGRARMGMCGEGNVTTQGCRAAAGVVGACGERGGGG